MSRTFGLVTALEIIEHLDSPRHFCGRFTRSCSRAASAGFDTECRQLDRAAAVCAQRELRQFGAGDYEYQHHISPITDVQMRLMLREIGFNLVASTTAGTFFGPLKRAVLAPVIAVAKLLWGSIGVGTSESIWRSVRFNRASFQRRQVDAVQPWQSRGLHPSAPMF